MSEAFPPDVQQFLQQELASGNYQTKEELVVEAVRLLRDSNLRLKQIREELRARLDRLDGGEGIELENDEALATFFDQIEAEVDQGLAADKKKRE